MRFVLCCLLLLTPTAGALAAKRALLIGIGRYQHTEGRLPLNTSRDIYWVGQTLRRQGFKLVELEDERATAQAIRNALNELVERCQSGDKVIIHYGGHGTQLPDQRGGDESDGLDETLIPYDAPSRSMPGFKTSPLFIRDDELALYLGRLRDKAGRGGHVLALIGACHAGTMSRGQANVRTDNLVATRVIDPSQSRRVSGWLDAIPPTFRASGPRAAVVLMAGAQATQNYRETPDSEGRLVGPLAFFFSEAMTQIHGQTTYRELAGHIRVSMRNRLDLVAQQPTLEGDSTARLLGGDLILPDLLTRLTLEAGKRFRQLKGGLMGYFKGAEVTVSIVRVRGDTVPTLVPGEVIDATPFESVVELNEPISFTDSVRLQTNLISQTFLPGTARVTVSETIPAKQRASLLNKLADLPDVPIVADGGDWLLRSARNDILLCRACDGEVVERFGPNEIDHVPSRLMAQAQANWLRDWQLNKSTLTATIGLVAARLDSAGERIVATLPVERRHELLVLRTNQQGVFTVSNTGTLPFFFTLIDIMPDARITVPLPNNRYPAESLKLLPGQSRTFPVPIIVPPLGLETYKLLLSRTPVDLQTLVLSRGLRVGGAAPSHPLVRLVSARFRNSTKQTIDLNEIGLVDFRFWIDKPSR